MEVGLFVFGLLVGIGLTWFLLGRAMADEQNARDGAAQARIAALQNELAESDAALNETKDRLIAVQLGARAVEAKASPLHAELAQAKRAAEQAIEQEMRQRELNAKLQDELAALKRSEAPAPAAARPAASPKAGPRPTVPGQDDLTAIKGVGKVIEKKLHELGIRTFGQIAALSAEDVHKINEAIEFPGRVERENWVEQARALAKS